MLFPPNPTLKLSAVFAGLYELLQEALRASCSERAVCDNAMPAGLWDAAQANPPTSVALSEFNAAVRALPEAERYGLWLSTRSAPSVRDLICDSTQSIPTPPVQLVEPLKTLVRHLFDKTSKLVGVEAACGETLHDYCYRYASVLPLGNGNVCGVCGTEVLAQVQHGIASDEQWRAAIDHLLAEAKYPLIALAPANLLPTCHTCNSKAKTSKDLLHDDQGSRRICFDPWSECAHGQVRVVLNLSGLAPEVEVAFAPTGPAQRLKLVTWDAVYNVRSRVVGAFSSLAVILSRDLDLEDLPRFRRSLAHRAGACTRLARAEPYNYWRSLLYQEMGTLPGAQLEQLRATCHEGLNRASGGFAEAFGV